MNICERGCLSPGASPGASCREEEEDEEGRGLNAAKPAVQQTCLVSSTS